MAFYNLFTDLKKQLDDNTHFNLNAFEPEVPPEVRLFLGRLSMLHGISPEYLVPDEKLLPKFREEKQNDETVKTEYGALRFFWIDPSWIECLLDGALSVGPDADREYLLTKAMRANYMAEVFQKEQIERFKKQLSGSYTPQEFKTEMLERVKAKGINIKGDDVNEIASPTNAQDNWRFTGFLLRSSLVASWRGIEIEVKGKDTAADPPVAIRTLQQVRMERIAPDTLFCLCEGIITSIVINQPPENLHFGLTGDSDTKHFTRQLSGISTDKKIPPAMIDVPMRGERGKRVINVAELMTGMNKVLSATTDSAGFAMEMVSQPIRNEITVNWEQEK
ncbi:MAG: hypothetical protein WCF67_15900 [Chitinophagaceae bacterium]